MKASNVVAPAKVTKDVPDLEEAFEEEDDGELVAEPKEDDEETELKKDKYIKQPKVKKPAAPKKASKNKGAKNDDEADEDDSEEVKPKKGRSKAKSTATKGKGKK
jgi:replication factor C subunit 1